MFLDEILAHKKKEIEISKAQQPLSFLKKQLHQCQPVRCFKDNFKGDNIRLIAEIKRASPSKGLLCPNFDPVSLSRSYEAAGASGISVLTDKKFFQGSLTYLESVKKHTVKLPILRKDFIIDSYQLVEARVYGADAVLLIVAALDINELKILIQEAIELELTPLVEVHNKVELESALETGAEVIGINNRDLKTFKVNLETTYGLIDSIPEGIIVVSESGIQDRTDIQKLAAAGVNAVLIGESIVTAINPEQRIRELMGIIP